ncbi:MAG: ABC transporter ATP-binding protein [Clostridia bacterium]|nr:ABC transporter ATP-binding protein [Clostridia bacterium]
MENKAIEVRDVQVGYEEHIVIPKLSLSIPKGKITIIIGPNGCGKSTLLKTIGRILSPQQGDVLLNGESIRRQSPRHVAQRMAVLPQSPVVPAGLMVRELVAYGRFPYQSPMGGLNQQDLEIVQWAMQSTGTLELADRMVTELSGGQRQRAWIAMALAQKTDILVLDEPTTYLDMANQLEVLNLLRHLNHATGVTVLIVMHELNNAIKFADHIVGMKMGHVVFTGEPAEVITQANLRELYDINATLEMGPDGRHPICIDYELCEEKRKDADTAAS